MHPIIRKVPAVNIGAVAWIFMNGLLLGPMMKAVGTPDGSDPNDVSSH